LEVRIGVEVGWR